MISRNNYLNEIKEMLDLHPICGILGPRQCGKTTLANYYIKQHSPESWRHFDLEDPEHAAQLKNPKLVLESFTHHVMIDEVQRNQELFPYLRVLADKQPQRKFLLLGSASRELIQQSSETLAGRIGYVQLPPFTLAETNNMSQLWLRGGFPNSYLAQTNKQSYLWRRDYIITFLERDIAQMGFGNISPQNMRRLWIMLSHWHGNTLNYSELARSLAISSPTVKHYIDILRGAFMVRTLQPWYENINKRQVKSPKIYIKDSGLLHSLLGISEDNIYLHPKAGASWEGFALEQIITTLGVDDNDCYYWATQNQAELDLFIYANGKRLGYEFKYTDHPRLTKSMHIAVEDLKLDELIVIVPGDVDFPLSDKIWVKGLNKVAGIKH